LEPDVGPDDAKDVDLEVQRTGGTEYVEVKDKVGSDLRGVLYRNDNSIKDKFTDEANDIDCSTVRCSADIRLRSTPTNQLPSKSQIRSNVLETLDNHGDSIGVDKLRIYTEDSKNPIEIEFDDDGVVRDIHHVEGPARAVGSPAAVGVGTAQDIQSTAG
jgi:hypothetical protein